MGGCSIKGENEADGKEGEREREKGKNREINREIRAVSILVVISHAVN